MEPDTFSDLYTVAESDYALAALERIFGGIIPFLAGRDEAYSGVGTFLSPLIGMMNLLALSLAVLVGAYTFFSLVVDTAADGQVLGRSTDTKNTVLRAGAAALLFLPISGGLSVIQLLAFGVAIGGSGMANQAWNWFAEQTLDGTAYTSPATSLNDGDWQMRGQLGLATYTMVLGRLCELHMDRLADTYDVQAQTTRMAVPRVSTTDASAGLFGIGGSAATETKSYEWFYQTGTGANASNDICGSVKYSITYNVTATSDQPGATESLKDFSSSLSNIAQNQVYNSVRDTLNNVVQPRAEALADRLYSGNPGSTTSSLRNDAVVQEEIRAIANAAALSIYNSRSSIGADSAEVQRIQEELIGSVSQNGWVMAPIWQRGLASLYTTMRELQTNLDLTYDADHRIGRIFGQGTYGFFFSANDVSRASFAPVERDFEYLESQLPFVVKLQQPDAGSRTNPMGEDAGAEMGGQTMRGLYTFFISKLGPNADGATHYKDPFLEYADIGSNLFMIAAPLVAGGSIAEGVAKTFKVDGIVGLITGPLKAVGYFILAVAVTFMLLIPAIPILYFFSGVMSWFALVIESVFALPLALLLWLVPAREPSMIGPWNKVMVTLCGLLLRPFFIIVGMIACILLLWIGNQFLAVIFSNMLLVMTPGWSVMAAVMMCGLIGLYCYATVLLALHCSSLINLFGDAVMNWIGGFASPLNRESMGENLAQTGRNTAPVPGIGGLHEGLSQTGRGYLQGRAKADKWIGRRNLGRLGSDK